MELKVGDKVRVKSLEWYNENKDNKGYILTIPSFIPEMSSFCGREGVVTELNGSKSCKIDIDGSAFWWSFDALELVDKKSNIIEEIAEIIRSNNIGVVVSETDGKLIIEPLKTKQDDIPIDTPCMCSNSHKKEMSWFVRYYAGNKQTWFGGGKSNNEVQKQDWECIIPWDEFNPNDLEESLKHNIVK